MRYHALILIFWCFSYLIPANFKPMFSPDETRYAEISREMIETENWVTPKLLGIRYFEKPIMAYWLQSLSMIVLGKSAFAVRLPSILAALGSAYLIFWLSLKIMACKRRALSAAIIYLSTIQVMLLGSYVLMDSILSFCVLASLCSFYHAMTSHERRTKFIMYGLCGVFIGIGFLTKGYICGVIFTITACSWLILHRIWRDLLIYAPWVFTTFLMTVIPWAWSIHQQEPTFWSHFLFEQNLARVTGESPKHHEPFWFYLPVFFAATFPWCLCTPLLLKKNAMHVPKALPMLLIWLLLPVLLLSCIPSKIWTYLLPTCAPFALLISNAIHSTIEKECPQNKLWLRYIAAFHGCLAGGLIIALGMIQTGLLANMPLYQQVEFDKIFIFIMLFMLWAALAFQLWKKPYEATVAKIACMPALLLVFSVFIVPNRTLNTKAPVLFVADIFQNLPESTHVIAEHFNIATSIAWALNKSDIDLLDVTNEFGFGLRFTDSEHRLIKHKTLQEYINRHTQKHPVALFMKRSILPSEKEIPKADKIRKFGAYMLYFYKQK